MGLDQSIRTDIRRIQEEMAKRGKDTVPYAGIAEEIAFYEERTSHADPENRFYAVEQGILDSVRKTIGNWRQCHFLHHYFEQLCYRRFCHGLDENGNGLDIAAPDLSNLLDVILCVLVGLKGYGEKGIIPAEFLLPNADIVYANSKDMGYGEDYRTELMETAEWLHALLSIPGIQMATFRYVYSY